MVTIVSQEAKKNVSEAIFHSLGDQQPGYMKENAKINNSVILICVTQKIWSLRHIFVNDMHHARFA